MPVPHLPLSVRELGAEGCATFLSEPRFEGLPCIFEGPGASGKSIEPVDMANAWRLRAEGLAARAASA